MSEIGPSDHHHDSASTYQPSMLDEDQSHSAAPLLPKSDDYETASADGMKELEMGDVKNLSPSPSPRPGSTFMVDDEWTPRFKRSHTRTRSVRRTCLLFLLKAVLAVWLSVMLYNVIRYCAKQSPKTGDLPDTSSSTSDGGSPASTPTSNDRRITIDSNTGNIHGVYPLYDSLSLTTTTGNITVAIAPQPAHPDHPFEPARLHIRSLSGTVTISFTAPEAAVLPDLELAMELELELHQDDNDSLPHTEIMKTCDLPARPYELDIQTESGPIAGRMVFSRSARLVSGGGDITAMLIPVIGGVGEDCTTEMWRNVSIVTEAGAGEQRIHVTEPYVLRSKAGDDAEANYFVAGCHVAGNGGMEVAYPAAWAGNVHVRTEGGSVRLEGEGVEVAESGEGMVDALVGTGRISNDEEDEDDDDDDDDDDEESDDAEDDDDIEEDNDDDDDERRLGGWMDVTFRSKEGSILFYVG
ncbi:uncharacterized protein NFIA_018810 [Aspergillus fischeri NRRL 181]|uniref:Uncharacterized protein n=1 Tax=Neosartorya fischeri (strain ATCC 1020 / DSM 3700 / CBS 544.65 / FGSC A1164 / JCM 1740 / NRRL 181 / WB 181) TaxID=331117 RepID=A1D437_NEOFI|nr:conserved hypothetical protein [Aspergillus fischeri NRRL 181]EAW23180.1 conserved hypothetical protein [Aspergillus fischeri NRRL 181]